MDFNLPHRFPVVRVSSRKCDEADSVLPNRENDGESTARIGLAKVSNVGIIPRKGDR
jgi:hypothetical protein